MLNLDTSSSSVVSISKTVDNTSIGLNEFCHYTITASFSGISQNLNSAKIEDFIPSNINYTLPPVTTPIESIKQTTQTGGTLLTFTLNPEETFGQIVNINIGASFNTSTPYGTNFINTSNVYVNGDLSATSSAPAVVYTNKADFHLKKQMMSPFIQTPSPGNSIIYAISLTNLLENEGGTGIAGSVINNVTITDTLPDYLTVDSSFAPIGNDVNPYEVSTPQYNGLKGTINPTNNSISFTLPKYNGTNYVVYFKAKVKPDVSLGTILNNTANWTVDGNLKVPTSNSATISEAYPQPNIGKSGPPYASPGDQIIYTLSPNNVGNTDLGTTSVIDNIPEGFTPTSINTGSYTLTTSNISTGSTISISYSNDNGKTYILIGTYNCDTSEMVNLPTLEGKLKYTQIKLTFSKFPLGVNTVTTPKIIGTLSPGYTESTLSNSSEIISTSELGTVSNTSNTVITRINNKSVAYLSKFVDKTSASSGDYLNYILSSSTQSTFIGPIMADLLPLGINFVNMTDSLFENGATGETNYNPPVTVSTISNFNNTGRTLVRFTFPKDFKAPQSSVIAIYFTAKLNNSVSGNLSNTAILGNASGTVEPYPGTPSITDNNDLLGNNIDSQTVIESNPTVTHVSSINSLSCTKYVKGSLNSTYMTSPNIAETTAGGSLDYKIVIKNSSAFKTTKAEIIDILPHLDDVGVIVNEPRNSQFPIYPIGTAKASLIPPDPNNPNPDLEIQYSTSYDPIRFSAKDVTGESTGTGTWTSEIPSPPTKIAALKLVAPNTVLNPGQSITITFAAITPPGVTPGLTAWNSLAYRDSVYDPATGKYNPQFPTEPSKVGISIKLPPPEDADVGDYVWDDSNYNGIQDPNENGINGVKVNLYNSEDKLIATTYTTTNQSTNEAGYYLFNGLKPGSYHVQFIKPTGYDFTIPNVGTNNNINSCVNPLTGMSSSITLTSGEKYLDFNAGLYKIIPPNSCIQPVIDIIESIALEETAIAYILNTEGEKLQKFLTLNPTIKDILNINASIKNTIELLSQLELILSEKLKVSKKFCRYGIPKTYKD